MNPTLTCTAPRLMVSSCAVRGRPGLSAYELARRQGYTGTEAQWLDELRGQDGQDGQPGPAGPQGPQGPAGPEVHRNRLCLVRGVIDFREGAHQTFELADVTPCEDLAVGDILLGTNWYTALVSGGTDELVYTTSTGTCYVPRNAGPLWADVLLLNRDAVTGAVTGGAINSSFAAMTEAYAAGRPLYLRRSGELIPLSRAEETVLVFEKTAFRDSANPDRPSFSCLLRLAQDGSLTGMWTD